MSRGVTPSAVPAPSSRTRVPTHSAVCIRKRVTRHLGQRHSASVQQALQVALPLPRKGRQT